MKSLDESKRLRWETINFDFRLNIDGSIYNHVNEFIPVTELNEGTFDPRETEILGHSVNRLEKG